MPERRDISAWAVADLVAHLGRLAYSFGFTEGLTPAQWTALRYLSRANRFSRTVSAFAEFHVTTRGTASQTINGLVDRSYLRRTRSATDGRSARLDLTEKARDVLERDPLQVLVRAVSGVSPVARANLATNLERLVGEVAHESGRRRFGSCSACRHREGGERCLDGTGFCTCRLLGETLDVTETKQLCVQFEPAR